MCRPRHTLGHWKPAIAIGRQRSPDVSLGCVMKCIADSINEPGNRSDDDVPGRSIRRVWVRMRRGGRHDSKVLFSKFESPCLIVQISKEGEESGLLIAHVPQH